MLDEADTDLRSVVALPAFEGLKVITTVRIGEHRQKIIASAKSIGADVIAMTTHARTGLKRLLFGSLAEAGASYSRHCCAPPISRP
jgi:nucleotide-binding universal stress UspA family protein